MPSLLYTGPRESRAPETEVLPDGRKRITRYLEVNSKLEIPAELNLTPGTADIYTQAPSGWTGLLLTYFKMVDDVAPKGKDSRPMLQMVWEQISPTGETLVGSPLERELPDGRIGYEVDHVMFSFNAFSPGIVGTDTAPNDSSAFLQSVEAPDDGTLRKIKRTYVYAGELATDLQTKNNGALSILTTTWAVTVPPTPSGYTLVGQPTQNPNGYPIYTYTFAKGTGQISKQIEYRQSPDVGVTGVTITTIKYLTVPTITTNPVTPPGGSVEIGLTVDDLDGYRLWTAVYAAGAGIIYSTVEQRNGGKLVIYKITSLNAIPSAPSATIGGTVTQISATKQNGSRFESGVLIYEYAWAEGEGEISQEITYSQSKDQGTNGITRVVIRYLTASSIVVDPTSAPSGTVNVGVTFEDSEGYRIWTSTYAKGQGTISSDVETRENGCLVIYKIAALGSAPSTPSATIGGTVTLIDADSRTEGGFTLYSYTWAEGHGLVTDESTISESGALVVYHRISLGIAPTTPTATLGGTVTAIETALRNADGYQIYDYRWSEGHGQSSITTRGEPDGALIYVVVDLAVGAVTPSYPGSGTAYLVELEQVAREGYFLNRAVYKKPPVSQGFLKQVSFEMPGQIEITSPDPGFQLVPPVRREILATVTVDYSTSQISTTPFSVSAYASINYAYVIASNGQVVTGQRGGAGYLSGATGASGSASNFNGVSCTTWEYAIAGSTPSAPPSGLTTIGVENEPYLVALDGTVVYRRIETTYTF